MDYDKLPDIWTIWILSYDPFGLDYRVYTVKNVVEESPKIEYNDGVKKLFLYTGGQMGGTKALQDLLAYIQSSTTANAVDENLKKLHANVERLKNNKQIGVKYMQMQEVIKYAVKAEVEAAKQEMEAAKQETEAAKQEIERNMKLTQLLLDAERYDDLRRITQDKEYLRKMLEEFGID